MKNKLQPLGGIVSVLVLGCLGLPERASGIDRVVGAVAPDGGAQLVKRFDVSEGSVVVGLKLVSNDLETVFPNVSMLQGPVTSTSEAVVLREVEDVHPLHWHRVTVPVVPLLIGESEELYVAVTFPVNDGVEEIGVGPGLGATQLTEPNGSFIGSIAGPLQAIDVDLAIDLIFQTVGKPDAEEDESEAVPFFLRVAGSTSRGKGRASVQFGLEQATDVTLTIYDVSGRLVRALASGQMEPGVHVRDWNGLDDRGGRVAVGVYFVKLDAQGRRKTQKLLLMR